MQNTNQFVEFVLNALLYEDEPGASLPAWSRNHAVIGVGLAAKQTGAKGETAIDPPPPGTSTTSSEAALNAVDKRRGSPQREG